jgi:hypothetical protein
LICTAFPAWPMPFVCSPMLSLGPVCRVPGDMLLHHHIQAGNCLAPAIP